MNEPMVTQEYLEAHTHPEPNTGCWLWSGSVNRGGYGKVIRCDSGRRREFLAHRIAWAARHGAIPAGLMVRHRCDTPLCVNPGHLLLGTAADNARDRDERGRTSRGVRMTTSRITEVDVRRIRADVGAGVPRRALALRYSMTPENIGHIVRGARWGHVK